MATSISSSSLLPPPAYEEAAAGNGSSAPCGLTSALWLSIFSVLVDPKRSKEEQAIGRSDLHASVRFVCRDFYLASMHILRSHHLPDYLRHVRPPYTTDPYPASEWASTVRRETSILDLYISLAVRAEVEMWESSLLMTFDGLDDLFAHHQPRARLEDVVTEKGGVKGIIYPASREKWCGLVGEDVQVDLRFKSAALRLLTSTQSHALRTIVEVTRGREESLEVTATHLIDALCRLSLTQQAGPRGGRVYQVQSR